MHKILEKLKEEFFAILPPTIFFFVMLHIVTFIRVLMAEGSHFVPLSTMSIAIAALILGKAVLVADMLPPINRYPGKPLVYNICLEDGDLSIRGHPHSLSGAAHRFLPAGGRLRRRQSEAARGNGVAAFLGGSDYRVPPNPGVLHGARTRARDRQGKDAAIVFRANAAAGILSKNDASTQLVDFSVKRIDIALANMLASAAKPK